MRMRDRKMGSKCRASLSKMEIKSLLYKIIIKHKRRRILMYSTHLFILCFIPTEVKYFLTVSLPL